MATGSQSGRVLKAILHRYVPASLYGGQTVYPILTALDAELASRPAIGDVVGALDKAKIDLHNLLSTRFPGVPAQALTVKVLNLFLARHHMRTRSAAVLSRPFGLVIDPSNVCRLACPGCVHSAHNEERELFDWPKATLSEQRFSALLQQYGPYAVGSYFCNYGEPLLNLQTPKLIRMAKSYLMRTALSTSLSVQKFNAEEYVEAGLDFMVISIDGATQEVYQKFRRNGELALALNNIRKLVEAKRRLGKRTPVLSWNFLAFEHNASQIPEAEAIARSLGVNEFRIVNPFDVTWDDPEIRPAPNVKGRVRRLNWESAAGEAGNWNASPGTLNAESISRAFETPSWNSLALESAGSAPASNGHTCHWLYKNMIMDATGRILPCCGAPKPDGRMTFGRFEADSTGDLYNSQMYRQARAFFADGAPQSSGGISPQCADCDWDQTAVNIGSAEIRRYFRAADPAFFDRNSLRLLADW